ncbi:MAG: DUF6055 domain-containing protein [Gammaproteobacteria bacterium]|nr:DUF6055 domain-containing protein [Gammaproteobacteria bacterium]
MNQYRAIVAVFTLSRKKIYSIISLVIFISLLYACSSDKNNQDEPKDYQAAPNIGFVTYNKTDPASFNTDADCTSFEVGIHPQTMAASFNEIHAGPISIIWGDNYINLPTEDANILTALKTDTTLQQNVIDNLLEVRRRLVEDHKISANTIVSAIDGLCYRVKIYISGTEAFAGDTVPSSGGGTDCTQSAEIPIPYFTSPYAELIGLTQATPTPRVTLHEYAHTIQCGVKRGSFKGWEWWIESFANFIGNDFSTSDHLLDQFHLHSHFMLDSPFTRYGAWPFYEFLRDKFGAEYTSDIVERVSYDEETLFEFIRRTAPFDCSASDNECRAQGFANLYADFANKSINYGYLTKKLNHDVKALANRTGFTPDIRTHLIKKGENHYQVADWHAPQRLAHNLIELVRDANNPLLSINFNGWPVEDRNVMWRATVVASLDDSVFPAREDFSETFVSGKFSINLDDWENKLNATIQELHLVIAAIPKNPKHNHEFNKFITSAPGYKLLDRFVYDFTLTGGWPLGHEPESARSAITVAGAAHTNGGGFVASTASVDSTAYVGPDARVLDNAQVLGNARIEGRAIIKDSAIVQDNAVVSSNAIIAGTAQVTAWATVRDNANLISNATANGESKVAGHAAYSTGFVSSDVAFATATPLYGESQNLALSGTATSNGHGWFNVNAYSMGTGYDEWTIDDQGKLIHYQFNRAHSYRIKDIQNDIDAYFLNDNGEATAATLAADTDLLSNVLVFNGTGYMALPKVFLDWRDYSVTMKMKWQASNGKQTLLAVKNDKGESLSLTLVPASGNQFDLGLSLIDRDGQSFGATLNNTMLLADAWLSLTLSFDDSSKLMKISTTPVGLSTPAEASFAAPYGTREFHYDSRETRLGSAIDNSEKFYGQIDDLILIRQ